MAWEPKDKQAFFDDAFNRNMGRQELSRIYGGTIDQITKYKLKVRNGECQIPNKQETQPDSTENLYDKYTNNGNYRTINLRATRIQSLDELIQAFKIDTDVWMVDSFECQSHEMGFKDSETVTWSEDSEGNSVKNVNWTSSTQSLNRIVAKFKRLNKIQELKDVVNRLLDKFRDLPSAIPFDYSTFKGYGTGRLLEISIYDHHFGKLAWGPEVGQDWDLNLAAKAFNDAVRTLAQKAASTGPIDRIVFPIGNDISHIDNPEGQTTSGTAVDYDSRYAKVLDTIYTCIIDSVTFLTTIAPVDIVIVPGNHDHITCYHIGKFLSAVFDSNPNVNVDSKPHTRKYYRWGQNLFMYAHGDKEKINALPLIMATEAKEAWGKTSFRFVKTGHLHKKAQYRTIDVNEEFGVQIETLPSLTATDEWHAVNGYVGNIRRAQANIYSKTHGHEHYMTYVYQAARNEFESKREMLGEVA